LPRPANHRGGADSFLTAVAVPYSGQLLDQVLTD